MARRRQASSQQRAQLVDAQELDGVAQRALGDLGLHDLDHLLADAAQLRGLGVAELLLLVRGTLGEAQGEQADDLKRITCSLERVRWIVHEELEGCF